jgi:hypothetical protein
VEIINECMEVVACVAFPDKRHIISKNISSRFTVGRKLEEFSQTVEERLQMKSANTE